MKSSSFFTEKAAQCRRLAAAITDVDAVAALLAMAKEAEAQATEQAERENR